MKNEIRTADYVADYIYKLGIETIFAVTGGGSMFLTDALALRKDIDVVFNHHEQASAFAAVAYAKYKGLGCVYTTSGCGGSNALTALLHAWQDNAPCIFISGQVKIKETIWNSGLALRQFGVQEADIISLAKYWSKYAALITDPKDIKYHLSKAVYLAKSARPGPVWLDIPLNIQSAKIIAENLNDFVPPIEVKPQIEYGWLIENLKKSRRPLIIAGQGIRLSGKCKEFADFINKRKIPFACSRLGIDGNGHLDLYLGPIGNKGSRAANFAIRNSDFILVIGSRLSVSSTGHNYDDFAPNAKIAVIDIDPIEHQKKTVRIDKFMHCDIRDFFEGLPDFDCSAKEDWLYCVKGWKKKYQRFISNAKNKAGIDLYRFMEVLSDCLADDDIVITDAGSVATIPPQSLKFRNGNQRYIPSGEQEMGFVLPALIGICKAAKGRAIGLVGDGSFQMNIQELQTMVHHHLPVKIFVWNNDGYLTIRATQNKLLDGRTIGTDKNNGTSFPSLSKIAAAYGIKHIAAKNENELEEKIKETLSFQAPIICEVICDPNQEILTTSSEVLPDGTIVSRPIEDMFPFLDRQEYKSNILPPPPPPRQISKINPNLFLKDAA